MNMFSIILENLRGYDLLIFFLALFNFLYILPRVKQTALALEQRLQPTIYAPIESILRMIREPGTEKGFDLHLLRDLRDRQNHFFHLHLTINSLFPLLGILGTVIALLRLTDLDDAVILLNFTRALTSTFWGLIFAILFKSIDGFIFAKVDENEADFNLLINRIDMKTKGEYDEA
ncbi:MotA/TolQ/ExbB proton channel family protein [Anaerotalea alkaliphila]|uniref:MotA/TolQ/ExbB proton channel family protein n=1 Tax=Anaerotalea alkaliphila TaxID=2662126 RepID=A0A7X5KLT0_9FIRM|nr:MotA/TolQ/ExbB proton channel family protein [Anaerotalea alkaliphila]NDL67156.1 MotA/TolQ/ExbB proton channel family protein [Anaerotalea alkaliphila]